MKESFEFPHTPTTLKARINLWLSQHYADDMLEMRVQERDINESKEQSLTVDPGVIFDPAVRPRNKVRGRQS